MPQAIVSKVLKFLSGPATSPRHTDPSLRILPGLLLRMPLALLIVRFFLGFLSTQFLHQLFQIVLVGDDLPGQQRRFREPGLVLRLLEDAFQLDEAEEQRPDDRQVRQARQRAKAVRLGDDQQRVHNRDHQQHVVVSGDLVYRAFVAVTHAQFVPAAGFAHPAPQIHYDCAEHAQVDEREKAQVIGEGL